MDDLPPPPYTPTDSNSRSITSESFSSTVAAFDRVIANGPNPLGGASTRSEIRATIVDVKGGKQIQTKSKITPNSDLGQALYGAVVAGDTQMVDLLLQQGACANTRPQSKKPSLVVAVERGDYEIVRKLLEQAEPDLEAKAVGGSTALYTAVSKGDKTLVRWLLDHGANANAKPGGCQPALFKAHSNGHKGVLEILLESPDINVDATPPGGTSTLWHAAENLDREILQALLSRGAKADAKPPGGATAMYRAAVRGDLQTTEMLLLHGAKADMSPPGGATALWKVVDQGNESMARLLLRNGADMNARRSGWDTALTCATRKGNVAMVRLLLEHRNNAQS